MARDFQFDARYYDRFYRDEDQRVLSSDEAQHLVGFVVSYLKYLEVDLDTALDLGCGEGLWRPWLEEMCPGIAYRGVELSRHACEVHGWERGSVVDYAGKPADLVICQGVLQYLPAPDARAALSNLGRLTRGALYLEALTREDWEGSVDQERTDGDVYLRTAEWYRSALRPHFISCGGGVFLPRETDAVLYELERGLL